MNATWVVVAESSRARIFSMDRPSNSLQELEGLTNPDMRMQQQDLTSDRPGRSHNSQGVRHALQTEVDPRHEEAIRFAKRIAERVEQGRTTGKFDRLLLAAPPEFLGLLRQHLSDVTLRQVTRTLDKNLVQMDPGEIRARLVAL